MQLALDVPRLITWRRAIYTVYIHSVTDPVKVQGSADGTNWVDLYTQGAAGNNVYTLAHCVLYLKVTAASGTPTGTFYLVIGNN